MPFGTDAPLPPPSDDVRAFLDSIGNRTDFPSFSANVQSIADVSQDLEAGIARLQRALVQDVSLTAKILQLANGIASQAGGGTITSVSQAILLLGFERVRHLALAASVFEQLHRKTPAVRELMALSLITANQSYHLAVITGFPKPELAYLAGMFQSIGEVIVACYRPREYARWLSLLTRASHRGAGAERKLFGVEFEEIGAAVATGWRMPGEIVRTMRRGAAPAEGRALHHVTRLSVELTNAIYRYGTVGDAGTLSTILLQYARPLALDEKVVREVAEIALADSTGTLRAVRAPVDTLRLAAQIRSAAGAFGEIEQRRMNTRTGEEPLAPDTDPGDDHQHDVPDPHDPAPAARAMRTRRALDAMRAAGDGAGEGFEIGRITRAALDAICQSGYRRAVLALASEDFARVRGRTGSGEGHERAVREFLVRLNTGTSSLAAAITARTDVFADAAEWVDMKRDPLLRSLAPVSFGLLTLVHGDRLLGCLYFDDTAEPVEVTTEVRALLVEVRDQLVAAFAEQRRRNAA